MTAFRRDLYAGLGTAREDRADCAVRALAVATGRPYAEMQRELARAGRWRHTPTAVTGVFAKVAESHGGRYWQPWRPLALRHFMAGAGSRGSWAIFSDTGRHLFAARDGTIHDWDYRPGLRVYSAWQF